MTRFIPKIHITLTSASKSQPPAQNNHANKWNILNFHKTGATHSTATWESIFFPFISDPATNIPKEPDPIHKTATHAIDKPKTRIPLTPAYKSTEISLFAPPTMYHQTEPFLFSPLNPIIFGQLFFTSTISFQMPTPKMDLKIHRNSQPRCDLYIVDKQQPRPNFHEKASNNGESRKRENGTQAKKKRENEPPARRGACTAWAAQSARRGRHGRWKAAPGPRSSSQTGLIRLQIERENHRKTADRSHKCDPGKERREVRWIRPPNRKRRRRRRETATGETLAALASSRDGSLSFYFSYLFCFCFFPLFKFWELGRFHFQFFFYIRWMSAVSTTLHLIIWYKV